MVILDLIGTVDQGVRVNLANFMGNPDAKVLAVCVFDRDLNTRIIGFEK